MHDEVFAAFARACEEEEFELVEHLLRAIEVIARQQDDYEQLDAAYALLAQTVDRPRSGASKGKR
ncbi:hypothetical protein [Caballeronia sp. ATUFL_F2_KS9A]|uniref:hypothetical protein n=1 Tax=Caballeronia sp. ATUFL_F2_KS9A TaxID=2921777 RepID=UPI00202819F6|nr:hypothetical protein [Caballeronia sp. ATUFL_F2_KS9A]